MALVAFGKSARLGPVHSTETYVMIAGVIRCLSWAGIRAIAFTILGSWHWPQPANGSPSTSPPQRLI
jgi:hypothetical protein